ncbi:MAG: DUF1800 domain-containing protein [Thiothrix sp.]|nr:DUF1800 domain-containing protein [Thiothrix sp.]HPQ94065.1 DUF1800 domain-containing protein [Thiolinea sp.]
MNTLTFSEARHLVARTGLGAEWGSIKKLEGLPIPQAVEFILSPPPSYTKPPPYMTPWRQMEPMRGEAMQRKDAWVRAKKEGENLQAWWIDQLLTTRSPFTERMTLFWHNYFTSSLQKTQQPSLLYRQNLMLRQNALGNFRQLLRSVARDPAMLVYLDGYKNVKASPNENFARELLELFTIGIGNYTEQDVRAAARAFTGWGVNPGNGHFIFRAEQHDNSRLIFLRRAGSFNGDDIIEILLQHPRTAERVVEKFWHEFVSDAGPARRTVMSWANQFRKADYDIKTLLRVILNSPEFWAASNRGNLVKSPVDLLIGTVRMIPYPRLRHSEMVNLCRLLGQRLFDPPSVKGWEGGNDWISTQTLLVRAAYLAKISRGNLNARVDTGLRLPAKEGQEMLDWLLAVPPVNPLPDIPGQRRLAHSLLRDPAFQVS